MQNVEVKIELRDLALARAICRAIGATHIDTIEQVDTYFRLPSGRLKKRETRGEPVEYVLYDRSDEARPRLSHFRLYAEAEAVARFGRFPLPVRVVVRKTRELHMLGSVRIHLDVVEGLGEFIEFEALVSRDVPVERCHQIVAELRERFAPVLGEPVAVGYADLLAPAE